MGFPIVHEKQCRSDPECARRAIWVAFLSLCFIRADAGLFPDLTPKLLGASRWSRSPLTCCPKAAQIGHEVLLEPGDWASPRRVLLLLFRARISGRLGMDVWRWVTPGLMAEGCARTDCGGQWCLARRGVNEVVAGNYDNVIERPLTGGGLAPRVCRQLQTVAAGDRCWWWCCWWRTDG